MPDKSVTLKDILVGVFNKSGEHDIYFLQFIKLSRKLLHFFWGKQQQFKAVLYLFYA